MFYRKIYPFIRLFIDPLVPKIRKKILLFSSAGKEDANLICIRQYLSYYYDDITVVVVNSKRKNGIREHMKTLYNILTSYYILVDHAIPRFISGKNHRIINVWHGIPIKNIRHFDRGRFTQEFLEFESENLYGLVCSSDLDKAVMAASFNVPPEKCIVSGLPRSDILSSNNLEWFYDQQESRLLEELQGRLLVAWMPTYRGNWYDKEIIDVFNGDEENRLCKLLKESNAVLGVRPHKFSTMQDFPLLKEQGLLIELSHYDNVNVILKHTRHLITDYSSVWLDFSLISSSVSLYLYDFEIYQEERGMIYPLEEVFPGVINFDFDSLYENLEFQLTSNNDDFSPSKLFFKYNDANNTRRFIEALFSR
ncbi:CDP-glycerol glycerophosphotransferase family protein [Vibrio aquimaris]|uniref:CDP-glycerol:glycerophosphate glycerophosphotransferase n=1 Tax=Vibrio aquimaris TaxID=2587862 RepID=A0A5P9CFB4_9VIBR|nr:CDP-glycerol glycerophosphotransferase family protein [Vibrio aquimaris]QFT24876.1 Putative CDP-glycerol:glycerophosphate glycerophosphotransferase [Vibrio aquimaris]